MQQGLVEMKKNDSVKKSTPQDESKSSQEEKKNSSDSSPLLTPPEIESLRRRGKKGSALAYEVLKENF